MRKNNHKAFKQLDILIQGVSHFEQLMYDPDLPINEVVRRQKVSKNMRRLWRDPAYRERVIEKQRGLGFRNYPEKV